MVLIFASLKDYLQDVLYDLLMIELTNSLCQRKIPYVALLLY